MSVWDAVGYLASMLVIAAFGMRAMVPLRVLAVCSNLAFFAYGLHNLLIEVLGRRTGPMDQFWIWAGCLMATMIVVLVSLIVLISVLGRRDRTTSVK